MISDEVYVITRACLTHHEFQHDQQFQEPTERVELAGRHAGVARACCLKEQQHVRISAPQ